MKKMLSRAVLGLLLGFVPALVFAQTGTIAGRTVDATDRSPVPGVNVSLEGTTLGAASDADGNFSFTAPPGDYTLAATFVGYERYTMPVTVEAGETTRVEVALTQGGINLDELVVTALGIERAERSIGYAVQEVEGELIARAAESNLVNALAGKTAGVQVTSSSGQPGRSARITIRGNSSLLGNNQPLFVVDGVPISNEEDQNSATGLGTSTSTLFYGGTSNRGLDLDPNIIEDINVLKGASATALYGSRAANGVVIITTKGARANQVRPRVSYQSSVRWDNAILEGYQNEYTQGYNGVYTNGLPADRGGITGPGWALGNPQTTVSWGPHRDSVDTATLELLGVDRVPVYDPRADFYQTGNVVENSLSLSGSNSFGNYFLSVSDLRQEGVVPGSDLDRVSVLAKFGSQLTDQLNVQTSVNYIHTSNTWLTEGNNPESFLFALNFTPISFDISDYQFEDGSQRMSTTSFNNPFWLANNNAYTSNVNRFIANTHLSYRLLPWLTISNRLGLDTYGDDRKEEINIGTVGQPRGKTYDQKIDRTEINNDLTVQAERALTSDLRVSALVGHNINSRTYNTDLLRGQELSLPGYYDVASTLHVIGEDQEEEILVLGAYSQLTFDYRDYLYLTLTARNDWSSTLPEDNNSYFYPSASMGFVFTEALRPFRNLPGLSYGKLRGSIAQIGSDAPAYAITTPFVKVNPGDGERGNINYPFNGVNGYKRINVLGNADLKPEISTEYEVGLDLRFFGQRVRLDAAYYDRSTRDQIFQVPLAPGTGYVSRLFNAGEIRNAGYELTLGGTPLQTRSWQWDLQANFTKNTTTVEELAEGVENIYLEGFTNPQIRIMPGDDGYGVIWGLGFARTNRNDPDQAALFEANPNLQEGQLLIGDDGLPVLADSLGPLGNVQPDWLANFRTTLSYRGLSLSALMDVRRGGDVMNMDLFYTTYYGTAGVTENRGTTTVYEGVNATTGAPNDVEVLRDQSYYLFWYSSIDENFVEDGSFVKLREISLSYQLPGRLVRPLGIQSARITGTGRNLWTGSNFSYGDPEGSVAGSGNGQGFYHAVTPGTRSYALSFQVTL